MKDAQVNLLQLNPVEVSTQLMVEDFTIFRQIEATEFVEDLFEIKSRYFYHELESFSVGFIHGNSDFFLFFQIWHPEFESF